MMMMVWKRKKKRTKLGEGGIFFALFLLLLNPFSHMVFLPEIAKRTQAAARSQTFSRRLINNEMRFRQRIEWVWGHLEVQESQAHPSLFCSMFEHKTPSRKLNLTGFQADNYLGPFCYSSHTHTHKHTHTHRAGSQ